jgi:RNA polymerase sigma-70 factor (ECF subfamily)
MIRRTPSWSDGSRRVTRARSIARLKETDTPEAVTQSQELQRAVEKAIAALPDDLRTAIILRELDGMSYEEIAQTMECPVGTVRSRIFRARDAISKKVGSLIR